MVRFVSEKTIRWCSGDTHAGSPKRKGLQPNDHGKQITGGSHVGMLGGRGGGDWSKRKGGRGSQFAWQQLAVNGPSIPLDKQKPGEDGVISGVD